MIFFASRISLITIAVLGALVAVKSQNVPKPELIDEFGVLPCEHFYARTDGFAEEIKREPTSKALILIYPPTVHPEQARIRRKLISSFLQLRGLNSDRYAFYKGGRSPDDEIRTQFWKMAQESEPPFKDAVLWNEVALDASRPFIFGYADEDGICPTFVPRAFAKLILDNAGSLGHIVVRVGANAVENRFSFAERHVKELVEEYGVPRKRLRLFFARGGDSLGAEFWFVPAKNK
jgi:hypothetical protein